MKRSPLDAKYKKLYELLTPILFTDHYFRHSLALSPDELRILSTDEISFLNSRVNQNILFLPKSFSEIAFILFNLKQTISYLAIDKKIRELNQNNPLLYQRKRK